MFVLPHSFQFNKEPSKVIDEIKLRVIYVPGNHPSPVHEESEEGTSPRSSMLENGGRTLFDSVRACLSLGFSNFQSLQQ